MEDRPVGPLIRIRRAAASAALLLGGLLAGCLVAEAILRLLDYEGLSLHARHPVLGQTYQPNHDTVIFDPESGRRIRVVTNSLGFRDRERQPGRTAARRVVVLGDSFAAALSVAFDDTFPQVCERHLGRLSPGSWEVLNFGVAGFGTAQELLAYREYGRRFHPEVVVLCFFSGNDVSDNSSELSSNPRVYFRLGAKGRLEREPEARLRRSTSSWLNLHSRFYLWQKAQTHKLEQLVKAKVVVNPVNRVFAVSDDPKLERAWAITRRLVDQLHDEATQDGARLLAVYVPFSDEVNPDWWQETLAHSPPLRDRPWDLEKPERLFAAHCRERGIELLSPRAAFLAEVARGGERLYFKHGHLNERGHRLLGETIAEKIVELQGSGPSHASGS